MRSGPPSRRRPPPEVRRGPTRALPPDAARLVQRSTVTDRGARFDLRFDQISQGRAQERRRSALVAVLGWVGGGLLVGLLAGVVAGPGAGALGALGVIGLLAARRVSLRLAARRGASAWDWQANRYRLIGQPANRVHELDQPREQPGRTGRTRLAP